MTEPLDGLLRSALSKAFLAGARAQHGLAIVIEEGDSRVDEFVDTFIQGMGVGDAQHPPEAEEIDIIQATIEHWWSETVCGVNWKAALGDTLLRSRLFSHLAAMIRSNLETGSVPTLEVSAQD